MNSTFTINDNFQVVVCTCTIMKTANHSVYILKGSTIFLLTLLSVFSSQRPQARHTCLTLCRTDVHRLPIINTAHNQNKDHRYIKRSQLLVFLTSVCLWLTPPVNWDCTNQLLLRVFTTLEQDQLANYIQTKSSYTITRPRIITALND